MEGFLGIGGTEFVIILIFAFLIFGPDKLPDIARTIGRAIAKFRDAQNEVNEVIRQEVYDPAADKDNPLQKAADKAADLNRKQPQTETFAERKARYDKIRAERKAKEEAAAKEAAAKEAAAGDAAGGSKDPASPASPAAPRADAASSRKPAPAVDDVDIDELLGVPPSPTPAAAPEPAEGGDA